LLHYPEKAPPVFYAIYVHSPSYYLHHFFIIEYYYKNNKIFKKEENTEMKIIGLMVFVLLIACPVSAEIEKQYDSSNKSSTIYSSFNSDVNPWDAVKFLKISQEKVDSGTVIMLFSSEPGLWFFSQNDMDIIIDDELYRAKLSRTRINMETKIHKETQTASYRIDTSITEKIIHAKKIAIKVYLTNKPDITWTVPDFVLNEWKQVLTNS
jgi:hypothetical protein